MTDLADRPFRIRDARPEDAAALLAIYRPYVEQTPVTFEVTCPSVTTFGQRIRGLSERFPWLVAEEERGVLGYAYASSHRERLAYQWTVEVSVYTAEHARRRGVGRALYKTLFALLKRQGFVNAYAGISVPNDESVDFHEALGFERFALYEQVGYKLGAWRDVGWWRLALNRPEPDPDEPEAAEDLRGSKAWQRILEGGPR